ncbi:16S rRNA (uracil(1498)-N(3))-methyltransferase [Elioraea tepida]|uniref:Ribosomal RNA small subunit methyltransferase E n=1 Tax=Elioraea tepida TaxID=2843330 RepID=A0A975YJ50_9PROT|nr:16S rRNA (uracil(1498)-N(3))-methyltransferase [Elioraea tepida]QXM24460.1 16S rRNA (uracil(1498)-N(3))-methyltransferase [Elioraea tepida]
MSPIRLFVPDPLAEGATIRLAPEQTHYLAAVMRRAAGDLVFVFNGRDGEWRARITTLGRGATLALEERTRPQEPAPDLWLLAPVLRRETLEWMVEKATELGVTRILPVTAERSAVTRTNAPRLRAIATEAAEQCRRLDVPAIAEPARLATVLAGWDPHRLLLVADESGLAPPVGTVLRTAAAGPWAVLVGPEGGFAPRELDGVRDLPFCRVASLGPRILRAETAAVATLAILQALAGDWVAGGPRDHHLR